MQVSLDVEIRRVSYRDIASGWSVVRAKQDGKKDEFAATGVFADVGEGELYQLLGHWSQHPQFGRQFTVERALPRRPTDPAAVTRMLMSPSFPGIGEKTAERMVKHFGCALFETLDRDPTTIRQVKGISKKLANTIEGLWRKDSSRRNILIFLQTHGISPRFAGRLLERYGEHATDVVVRNPYQLAQDFHGIGFRKADEVARSVGITADAPQRIEAGLVYLARMAEDQGHCYQTRAQLLYALEKELQVPSSHGDGALAVLVTRGDLILESPDRYYRRSCFDAEQAVAAALERRVNKPSRYQPTWIEEWLSKFQHDATFPLSDAQIEAVRSAGSQRMFILTGGPGVGKTTTSNAIIKLFKDCGANVALCAPTGRAAQRLAEVSGEKASTIHRLLELNPADPEPKYHDDNPLPHDVVMVDEVSMLDIYLAAQLFRALREDAHLILVGDADQLPSVGAGNVLSDLLRSSRIPHCTLKEVFRQAASSHIVRHAHRMNVGEMPHFDQSSDCKFIEVSDSEMSLQVIEKLVREKLPYDFIREVQILTPQNRGPIGTEAINQRLQASFNPGEGELRCGDRVIQTSNNYERNVFNGDIGVVESLKTADGAISVRFQDRLVHFSDDDRYDLRLAYAITIHKSQGSEFPVVIVPTTMQHYAMLQRNLFYTALTRARKLAIFVGESRALQRAIQQVSARNRQTRLAEKIAS